MINVPDTLLALAAAARPDQGASVARALAEVLGDACPYDIGELAVMFEGSVRRVALPGGEGPACADDLLLQVTNTRLPVRLDQLDDAEPFPDTRALLRRKGMRALLALPFGEPGPRGALVLVRQQGWGLVGAPLFMLAPVATMAGIALERSLMLSAAPSAAPVTSASVAAPPPGTDEQLWQELATATAERDAARLEGQELAAERERLRGEVRDLTAALEAERRKPNGNGGKRRDGR